MRLRKRDLKSVYIRPRIPVKDNEGSISETYGAAFEVKASIQPLSGQILSSEYGENLKYMISMRVDNIGAIKEKDGVCINVNQIEEPDYEVESIKTWDIPILELKRRGV